MKKNFLIVLIVLAFGVIACSNNTATETPVVKETVRVTNTPAVIIPVTGVTETTIEPAATEVYCSTPREELSNYLESSSQEAFSYNQIPSDFGGHRYVIAITHTDGSHSIAYGEVGTTWTTDETVAKAMVNLIQDGGYETVCIANGFAEAVKPSLGKIPVVMIP